MELNPDLITVDFLNIFALEICVAGVCVCENGGVTMTPDFTTVTAAAGHTH